jgi:Uma2 family endonuclease
VDLDNELQPDGLLMIEPTCGGQAIVDEEDYVVGAPEWVGEIASSTVSYDLHAKLHVYRRAGVREYVVWRVLDEAIDWFCLVEGQFAPQSSPPTGVYQSEVFPGFWLDVPAMLRRDMAKVLQVLHQGLATPEHTAFVERLRQAGEGRHS